MGRDHDVIGHGICRNGSRLGKGEWLSNPSRYHKVCECCVGRYQGIRVRGFEGIESDGYYGGTNHEVFGCILQECLDRALCWYLFTKIGTTT